jgi:catechol 2,3-dioxygenase-like lactoylglutathione lyase family enzyme
MITGMDHFSFTVSNLEEAIHFFCDILGLKANPVVQRLGSFSEKLVGVPGSGYNLCNVITPDNVVIELMEYIYPKGTTIDLNTWNIGVAHVAFKVDDIQKTYEELTRKGIKFDHEPMIRPLSDPEKPQGVLGYIKGPDNITVEFIGPLKQVK